MQMDKNSEAEIDKLLTTAKQLQEIWLGLAAEGAPVQTKEQIMAAALRSHIKSTIEELSALESF